MKPNLQKLSSRRWRRFKANKRGYYSLILFSICFFLSLGAEILSNDRPLLISYQGRLYFPLLKEYPETTFGGEFETETDYQDPFIKHRLTSGGRRVFGVPRSWATIQYRFLFCHKVPPPLAEGGQGVGVIARPDSIGSFTHPSIPSRQGRGGNITGDKLFPW